MNAYLKKPFSTLYHALSDLPHVPERAHRSSIGSMYRRWGVANPCPEFATRDELYQFLFESERLDCPIDYLEFGVWQGESIRWWVGKNHDPASSFVGFDSFEGLPVNWDGMPAGAFSTGGKIPDIPDPRCQFVKGLFHETLPNWLRDRDLTRRLVVNLDADLYGSSLLVLVHLLPRLKPGDVITFDEFHSFMHEFRAFQDSLLACPRDFAALGRAVGWSQVALKVV